MATVLLTPFYQNSTPQNAHDALKLAITTMAKSKHCAVLWFAEINARKIYRKLGYSSMYQYAQVELGFSNTRTGDFLRLAKKLDELPGLKKELEKGEIGYTKGLEVAKVANSKNEKQWLEEARNNNRNDLAKKVNQARKKAQTQAHKNKNQTSLLPGPVADVPVAAIKHRISFEMSTEQFAQYEALWEKLHKLGGVPVGSEKVDLVLKGLVGLIDATDPGTKTSETKTPETSPVQIHVHQCPDCEKAAITTSRGEIPLAASELDRLSCDAHIKEDQKPNRATIPPSVRRNVLSRDRHRCRGAGCPNTMFLEVHHIVLRKNGGSNRPDNLVTLCGACHQVLHERKARGLDAGICPPAGEME